MIFYFLSVKKMPEWAIPVIISAASITYASVMYYFSPRKMNFNMQEMGRSHREIGHTSPNTPFTAPSHASHTSDNKYFNTQETSRFHRETGYTPFSTQLGSPNYKFWQMWRK